MGNKIIGIDLGTTNSCVSVMENGEAKVIANPEGLRTTASVVSFKNGEIVVGEAAKRQAVTNKDTIMSIKRHMGTGYKTAVNGKEYTPQEISAMILQNLKATAEAYLGESVNKAVITVPAYFNDAQRQATKDAGKIAGLEVERIINEPTAAALAFGVDKLDKEQKVLVYDLGGGTFDVSILELFQNILEVRAVAGDNYLGGEDFTEVLEKMFLQENKIDTASLDEKTKAQIRKQAELCKLGFLKENTSQINCNVNGQAFSMSISIEKYEEACEGLFEKIRKPVQRSLADAHIKLADIDVVVLVGGATKLPIIKNFIIKLFRKFPDTNINPDEAVALGAAIQAAMKERNQAVKEVILTDVCSFTLGTEVSIPKPNGEYEAGHFCPIIERNTVIPASRTEKFYTLRDGQTKLNINILQGESRLAANNLLLGELEVVVPKNKAGAEGVEVTYTYDINSILEVEVKVLSTGEVKKQIIKNQDNDMTEEEIEERMKELSYLKIHPREQEENKLLLLRCESLYEESTGDIRRMIDYETRKFEEVLNTRDRGKIEEARTALKKVLQEIEEYEE